MKRQGASGAIFLLVPIVTLPRLLAGSGLARYTQSCSAYSRYALSLEFTFSAFQTRLEFYFRCVCGVLSAFAHGYSIRRQNFSLVSQRQQAQPLLPGYRRLADYLLHFLSSLALLHQSH